MKAVAHKGLIIPLTISEAVLPVHTCTGDGSNKSQNLLRTFQTTTPDRGHT